MCCTLNIRNVPQKVVPYTNAINKVAMICAIDFDFIARIVSSKYHIIKIFTSTNRKEKITYEENLFENFR